MTPGLGPRRWPCHTKVLIPIRGRFAVRRQRGLLPNSTRLEINDMIEVDCLPPVKEEAVHDGETPVCS